MMTSQDFDAFHSLMNRMAKSIGRTDMDVQSAEFLFAVLNNSIEDCTITELTKAIFACLKKSKFWPTPYDIINAVEDIRYGPDSRPEYEQFALPPAEYTPEEDREAMAEAKRRIQEVINKVVKPMPSGQTITMVTDIGMNTTDTEERKREIARQAEFLLSMEETND